MKCLRRTQSSTNTLNWKMHDWLSPKKKYNNSEHRCHDNWTVVETSGKKLVSGTLI